MKRKERGAMKSAQVALEPLARTELCLHQETLHNAWQRVAARMKASQRYRDHAAQR